MALVLSSRVFHPGTVARCCLTWQYLLGPERVDHNVPPHQWQDTIGLARDSASLIPTPQASQSESGSSNIP